MLKTLITRKKSTEFITHNNNMYYRKIMNLVSFADLFCFSCCCVRTSPQCLFYVEILEKGVVGKPFL